MNALIDSKVNKKKKKLLHYTSHQVFSAKYPEDWKSVRVFIFFVRVTLDPT